MSKTLNITDDKVRAAIKECPESADVLKTLFPDVCTGVPELILVANPPHEGVAYALKAADGAHAAGPWILGIRDDGAMFRYKFAQAPGLRIDESIHKIFEGEQP